MHIVINIEFNTSILHTFALPFFFFSALFDLNVFTAYESVYSTCPQGGSSACDRSKGCPGNSVERLESASSKAVMLCLFVLNNDKTVANMIELNSVTLKFQRKFRNTWSAEFNVFIDLKEYKTHFCRQSLPVPVFVCYVHCFIRFLLRCYMSLSTLCILTFHILAALHSDYFKFQSHCKPHHVSFRCAFDLIAAFPECIWA